MNTVNKPVERVSFESVDNPQQYVEADDEVSVINTEGEITSASFKNVFDKPIRKCDVNWKVGVDNLYEFWKAVDKDINPNERVVGVEISNSWYEFPESKIFFKEMSDVVGIGETIADSLKDRGYRNFIDLVHASMEDLTEVGGIGNARAARIKDDVGYVRETDELSHNTSECPVSGCYTSIGETDDFYTHMIDKHGFWNPSLEDQV